MRRTDPHYQPDIDGLRAIAIILVVIYHLQPRWVPGGFVGVDVFFVISGYLITSLLVGRIAEDRFSIFSFYRARIRRLFPALLIVLLTSLIWGWFRLLPVDYASLGRHTAATLGFFENFLLKHESGYFDESANWKPLAHAWSLSIEEQFYLLFPWLLITLRSRLRLLLIVFLLLWAASFYASTWLVKHDATGGYLYPWSRFWELLSGSILGLAHFKIGRAQGALALLSSALGLIMIFISAFMLNETSHFPGFLAIPPTLGAILIIHGGKNNSINKGLLSNEVMVYIGLLSYPIYLWHWPLRAFLLLEVQGTPTGIELVILGVLSTALAHVTYYGIERPIRERIPEITAKRIALLLVLVAGIIAGLATAIRLWNGLPIRYPSMPAELAITNPSAPEEWRPKRCFLWPKQLPSDLSPECFSDANRDPDDDKSRILLWGDSYAAQLYPGLSDTWGDRSEITQITAMACPPIYAFHTSEYPNCDKIFEYAFDFATHHPFDAVLVAAQWDFILNDVTVQNLESTLDDLIKKGVNNLIIVGPPPRWEKALPKLMLSRFLENPQSVLPDRLNYGYSKSTFLVDSKLASIARVRGIGYLSLLNLLCNKEGCLTRKDGFLTSPDTGHLSISGSRAIFEQLQSLDAIKNNR